MLGFDSFDHSSIVRASEYLYLFAAPKNGEESFVTYIFKFENLPNGGLKRENGKLKIYNHIKSDKNEGANAGESDYDEQNTNGGILFPQIILSDVPEVFQIFKTEVLLKK